MDRRLVNLVSCAIVLARNDYLNSHNPISVPLTDIVIEKLFNSPEAQAVARAAIEAVLENKTCCNCGKHLISPVYCCECLEEFGDFSLAW